MQYELFGQMVLLEQFGDTADALAMANANRCGLPASVYTTDLNRLLVCQTSKQKLQYTEVHFRPCGP